MTYGIVHAETVENWWRLMEKRLEVQDEMVLGFVDLKKAFDTVPREMVMATLR